MSKHTRWQHALFNTNTLTSRGRERVVCLIFPLIVALLFTTACDRQDPIRTYKAPKDSLPAFAMGRNHADQPSDTPPSASPTAIHWQSPPDWRQDPQPKPPRVATFWAGESNNQAEISLTTFSGTVGGILPNINRWRAQINLPPVDKLEDQPMARLDLAHSLVAAMVDVANLPSDPAPNEQAQPARIIAAIIPLPDRTWFVKMTGPSATLENQKAAFASFVSSITFGDHPGHDHTNNDNNSQPQPPAPQPPAP